MVSIYYFQWTINVCRFFLQSKMTETTEQEQVVMTPKCKSTNSTTLIIERRIVQKTSDKMHVAGGEHTGIVINKEAASGR